LESGSTGRLVAIMIKNGLQGFKGAALCIGRGSSSSVVHTAIPADTVYKVDNVSLFDDTSRNATISIMDGVCSYE